MELHERGDPEGAPVLYFHGTPGSAADGPTATQAAREGVRLFTLDRPGYAQATAAPSADLVDVAGQAVERVAERGVAEIVVVGWSGGGPYALAAGFTHPSKVAAVGLLASWAPMDPPHPGLPAGVRAFMRAGRWFPRPALRAALAVIGRTSVGQLDDIRRIARPWVFAPEQVAQQMPVVASHGAADAEVPIEPWLDTPGIDVRQRTSADHQPGEDTWDEVLRWAARAGR